MPPESMHALAHQWILLTVVNTKHDRPRLLAEFATQAHRPPNLRYLRDAPLHTVPMYRLAMKTQTLAKEQAFYMTFIYNSTAVHYLRHDRTRRNSNPIPAKLTELAISALDASADDTPGQNLQIPSSWTSTQENS